tara:strand:- start:1634 stop:1918 length:285 start_codon:yes stop_codon:yes gene_type:complete
MKNKTDEHRTFHGQHIMKINTVEIDISELIDKGTRDIWLKSEFKQMHNYLIDLKSIILEFYEEEECLTKDAFTKADDCIYDMMNNIMPYIQEKL